MRERIESFDDPRLDDYRNIPDPALLATRQIFVAEGRLVVGRLLESTRFATRSLMLTSAAVDAMAPALGRFPHVPVYEVSQQTMDHVAGFNVHRGCLAIGERGGALASESLAGPDADRLVALEDVANPDNVGSIFRHAAAFGTQGVLLDERTADPLYRKALRTSMGAALHVPFARAANWPMALDNIRRAGFTIVGLTPSETARPVRQLAESLANSRIVLLFGHEGDGLRPETRAICDECARIPMRPDVDSLNVATAAAITLYEFGGGRVYEFVGGTVRPRPT